jgi:hypothetical protein
VQGLGVRSLPSYAERHSSSQPHACPTCSGRVYGVPLSPVASYSGQSELAGAVHHVMLAD